MTADPVSVHVGQFEGVRSLADERSLGDSTTLGAEATGEVASDQNTSAIRSIYRPRCSRQSTS
jgi:hypothetical protein